MADPHHWTPDLLEQLVNTVPRLVRGKQALLDWFVGAGVPDAVLRPHRELLARSKEDFKKFAVAQHVLVAINSLGDPGLGPRRQVLHRVTTFDAFCVCFENEREKAELGVRRVRELIDRKDSFTEMRQEREREAGARRAESRARAEAQAARDRELEAMKTEFSQLFAMPAGVKRGYAFEAALNKLFRAHGLLTRDSFKLRNERGVILEQIDGAIEVDGMTWLVESKWWDGMVNIEAVGQHICRVMVRPPTVGALLISGSGFTVSAVATAKQALANRPVVLMTLADLWKTVESKSDLAETLRRHFRAAQADLNPYLGRSVPDDASATGT